MGFELKVFIFITGINEVIPDQTILGLTLSHPG